VDRDQREERRARARGDQRADVDRARGDGPRERRDDPRETLLLQELTDVRLLRVDARPRDGDGRLVDLGLRALLIEILLRREALRGQLLVALEVRLREVGGGD